MTDWYGKPAGQGEPPPESRREDEPSEPAPPTSGPEDVDDSALDRELDDDDEAPAGPEPRVLVGHQALSLGGSGGLCCGLLFGLLMLLAGLAVVAHTQGVLYGYIPPEATQVVMELEGKSAGLRWDLIGWPAALLGVIAIANTIGSNVRAARRRWGVVNRPEEPWQHDHPWDPERGTDRAHVGLSGLFGLLGFALFLLPFHALVMWIGSGPDGAFIGWIILGFFDLIMLAAGGYVVYTILRSMKYSGAELRWPQFPLMVGQPVTFTFTQPPALQRMVDQPELQVALRCLHDETVTTGSGKNRSTTRAVMVLHELTQTVPPGSADEEGKIKLSFQLPPGAPATDLISTDPTYWELEIKAETPGIDYLGQYLVPVY